MNTMSLARFVTVVFGLAITGLPGTYAADPPKNEASITRPGAFEKTLSDLSRVNLPALRRAVKDLSTTFPKAYKNGDRYLRELSVCETTLPSLKESLARREASSLEKAKGIIELQKQILLDNPLLDFDKLLLIKRKPLGDPRRAEEADRGIGQFIGMPKQSSWQLQTMPNATDWDNEICILSPVKPTGKLTSVYKPSDRHLVSEMDLHFDAQKLMFSMPDAHKLWQVHELDLDSKSLRQLSPANQPEVHNFDSCYLPNGRVAFTSTAAFQGVPCNASVNVGMLYLMDRDGQNVRQVCFEQDHDFCPTVLNDGRVLYLRWEYTDIPHVWARFLFTMNPDGTNQREFYGSGGYWPNAMFYTRPIPNHPTKIVSIVTGHHVGRVGELVVFDPAKGRQSTDGVVQRIPGHGQTVDPVIMDKLAMDSWPKFLHPWPLSDKYFIVTAKPRPQDLWGIYLVDVFDNMLLLKELEDFALLEPIPLRTTPKPRVIPDRVDLSSDHAIVYIENIYKGPGLKNVPHGEVKTLRLFTYHFAYHKIAGINHRVGADGPWEPKRILGTVPVEADGSALFRVPANTPISIQPLDGDNKALQLMRSWMTAMPGEIVSCVGCHEKQNAVPTTQQTIASRQVPADITPWYGPARGFSFMREVQPVLDQYCVSCHDGQTEDNGQAIPDLRADQGRFIAYKNGVPKARIIHDVPREELVKKYGGVFDPSYIALRGLTRVGGLESDLRMLDPGEFHADTTELVQMLKKGHHGVRLDGEAWDRLIAWIDLNAPCHGTWSDIVGALKTEKNNLQRRTLRARYGGITENPEQYPDTPPDARRPILPLPEKDRIVRVPKVDGWPFKAVQARQRQGLLTRTDSRFDLGDGITLTLKYVPTGTFVMGSATGHRDEYPPHAVTVEKPFWISQFEITNAQYACFDASHDSRFQDKGSWMFNEWDLGWDLNTVNQPVIRVSWQEAMAFCQWLSDKTGLTFELPTEAQWEWACRAGTDSPFYYGDLDTDFSAFANMGDATLRDLAYDARDQYSPDLVPRDDRFNDRTLISADVGTFGSNAWGLHDMHGNVWEWTRSTYQPYPYADHDGRNDLTAKGDKVVRGGSWYDRPKRCSSSFRLSYPAWRKVYNVGFRVVMEAPPTNILANGTTTASEGQTRNVHGDIN
ncbi:MAG: SUMF1/EgtB/PvdO family nonheme iron enzyme [Phycisphaeraceae bacterium]|nr:SUMF1/EgtB/PvdO family nonheme iron enzyme [Phycisphaeraceae bacterium]